MTFNSVVNHVSDESKKGGIIESYQYIPMTVEVGTDEDGTPVTQTQMMRINFVIWPGHPVPFVHEELSSDLVFDNVYVGSIDEQDDNENDEIVEALQEKYPEIYDELVGEEEEEEEEEEDNSEDDNTITIE